MDASAHTVSLQQTLKGVESKLSFLGPGPHTPQQSEELKTLTAVKQKLVQQIKASMQGIVQQQQQQQQQTQQQSSMPATIAQQQQQQVKLEPTTTQMMVTTAMTAPQSGITPKPVVQHQVVLTKPRPAAPQLMQQAASENDTQILNRQRLQELVKEIDPTEQLDEDVEEMLMQITDDFIEKVVSASCELARHRKSNTLEAKDIKLHLEKHWNITIPGYGSDEIRTVKKTIATDAHKQRLALIRKATKK